MSTKLKFRTDGLPEEIQALLRPEENLNFREITSKWWKFIRFFNDLQRFTNDPTQTLEDETVRSRFNVCPMYSRC